MKTFRFNHYGKAGPYELFYITTPAESDEYVLFTEAEAEITKISEQRDGYYDEAKKAFAERDKSVELLSLRYTNLNQDGKTILDFQNVWIEQARDRNIKLEAEIALLKNENGEMDSTYQDRLLDMESRVNEAEENLVLYAKSYDANIEGYQQEIAALREQLEVCNRLGDTFWDALKPLGLKEIYLSCPGQHVVDLISERDKLKDRQRVLVDALERYISKFGNCGDVYDQAMSALEA